MNEMETFSQVYCQSRGIQESSFEQSLLREVLYPLGKPLSLPLLIAHPGFFGEELDLIHELGNANEFEDFAAKRNKLIDFTLYQITPWRKVLGIRASGRKLFQIGNRVDSKSFRDR